MKKLVLCSVMCFLLSGCGINLGGSSQEIATTQESVSSADAVISTEVLGSVSDDLGTPDPVKFNREKFPIMVDGLVCGWGNINFIEKLGIWDWYNDKAVKNGVKYSYTINLDVDMSEYLGSNPSLSIECRPLLMKDGDIVGEPCNVGWSGFYSVIELFPKNMSGILEVGVQPLEQELAEGTDLLLQFNTADGSIHFDDVCISNEAFLYVKEGPSILTIKDSSQIESINGALYTVKFSDVFFERHKVEGYNNFKDGLYDFYDFKYKIKYDSAPINNREVANFDSFDKYAFATPLKIRVQSDTDCTWLDNEWYRAQRLLYSDWEEWEYYCLPYEVRIKAGKSKTFQSNRRVPDTTKVDAQYVRITIEFPEERTARTDEELKNFSGRFLVWQIPLGSRELGVRPR